MKSQLLEILREQTSSCHTELEEALLLPTTPLEYGSQLATVGGFVLSWEEKFLRVASPILVSFYRSRTALLRADLGEFGVELHNLPRPGRLPGLRDSWEAWGSAYVLEGSRLGGLMIAHHAENRLGVAHGLSFYLGSGVSTGAYWKEFCQHLSVLPQERTRQIVDSAIETFECLRHWVRSSREAFEFSLPVIAAEAGK